MTLSDDDLPSPAAIAALVDEVTYGVLGVGSTLAPPSDPAEDAWTCGLPIGAPADLILILRCPESFARRVADAMLGQHEPSGNIELVRESLAEFTSILGGNLKSLIPPLSCAPLGSPHLDPDGPGQPLRTVALRCGSDVLSLSLIPSTVEG